MNEQLPTTVFFGNGINRLNGSSLDWERLIQDISDKVGVDCKALLEAKKYTMAYERMIVSRNANESTIKSNIVTNLENVLPSRAYEDLADLKADYYVTTNYEHLLSQVYQKKFNAELIEHYDENIYSIRRNDEIQIKNGKTIKIWNAHGSIKKHATLMLGYDHYCGGIGKIDSYIKGSYTWKDKSMTTPSIISKLKNGFDNTSWIELFFKSNIHILGLGLSFDELDIWWILNKRARFMMQKKYKPFIKNSIYYYCKEIDTNVKIMLESYGVKVLPSPELSYENIFYNSLNRIILNTK